MRIQSKPPVVRYDPGSRILSIRVSPRRSVNSDVHGNVVVDYDAGGIPVNIDIMECSLNEFRRAAPVRRYVHVRRGRRVAPRTMA